MEALLDLIRLLFISQLETNMRTLVFQGKIVSWISLKKEKEQEVKQ
jgi:hypothetical protein